MWGVVLAYLLAVLTVWKGLLSWLGAAGVLVEVVLHRWPALEERFKAGRILAKASFLLLLVVAPFGVWSQQRSEHSREIDAARKAIRGWVARDSLRVADSLRVVNAKAAPATTDHDRVICGRLATFIAEADTLLSDWEYTVSGPRYARPRRWSQDVRQYLRGCGLSHSYEVEFNGAGGVYGPTQPDEVRDQKRVLQKFVDELRVRGAR